MILVDTGAWLALVDHGDAYHERCRRFFRGNREQMVTTLPVLVETVHLMYARVGVERTLRWLDAVAATGLVVRDSRQAELARLIALMQRYANLPMDVADASLVLAAEDLGDGRIVTTDERDFDTYRWKDRAPFTNLLRDGTAP